MPNTLIAHAVFLLMLFFGSNSLSAETFPINAQPVQAQLVQTQSEQSEEGSEQILVNKHAQTLVNNLKAMPPFFSSYEQNIVNAQGAQLDRASGAFYFGGGKKFKNIIHEPDHSVLVSDGTKFWLMDHELEQVSINYLEDFIANSPLQFLLTKPEQLEQYYRVALARMENGSKHYRLSPVDTRSLIQFVELYFTDDSVENRGNTTTAFLSKLNIHERSGNVINIRFYGARSLSIEERHIDQFTLLIPKAYDIVDETL